jgi:hypothetical protein
MPLRISFGRKRDEGSVDELVGARLLLLAGRSPDEQFDLLQRLGCLSPRGQGERMGVILLLSRLYEAHVARGYQPPDPLAVPETDLAEIWTLTTSAPPIGSLSDRLQLSRIQCDALVRAGYLDAAACRGEVGDLEGWWSAVLPQVGEIHAEHDRIFAAIAPKGNLKPGQRTDSITCPLCGRPAARGATYCVWCGCWLAARPR